MRVLQCRIYNDATSEQFKDISECYCCTQFSWLILTNFSNKLLALERLVFTWIVFLPYISYNPLKVLLRCTPTLLTTTVLIIKLITYQYRCYYMFTSPLYMLLFHTTDLLYIKIIYIFILLKIVELKL